MYIYIDGKTIRAIKLIRNIDGSEGMEKRSHLPE
jgi:hypothetical protein